ncbi:predicted protein [Histoplasma capsulatum G186AR]|uniref:Uncharacterized protein n=1 Tax=Ajellomyces capsulatus (strain G186AR / H82 / ATCC MYA-2454 / RMSCC 2432) TaxID=447093 RepID=C0NUN9_AJECG|nr:uncharacterized protein HCBG_06653 [Histoplasma capsulatum G186AR]EEH04702.1 predicted protein [Histoplasma capsulatum G186AR]
MAEAEELKPLMQSMRTRTRDAGRQQPTGSNDEAWVDIRCAVHRVRVWTEVDGKRRLQMLGVIIVNSVEPVPWDMTGSATSDDHHFYAVQPTGLPLVQAVSCLSYSR